MVNIKNKNYKFSTIFKSCLILSLGTSLIGCGGGGSAGGSSKVAAGISLDREVPIPEQVIKGKEAEFNYTIKNDTAKQLLTGAIGADGASKAKIISVSFPQGVELDNVTQTCTGKELLPGESCQYSGELTSENSVKGNITVKYTSNGKETSKKFPLQVAFLPKEQVKNTLSVPGKIVFLDDSSIQVILENDSKTFLNNVSIHLDQLKKIDADLFDSIDFSSIKGGQYDSKEQTILMEENLGINQKHTFQFKLKASVTEAKFVRLAKQAYDKKVNFIVDAANAPKVDKPISFSLNKNVLFIGLDGVKQEALKAMMAEKDFATKYPALSNMINNGYQYWNLYAGGVNKEPSQQATVTAPGFTTLLTGVWANKHKVTDNDKSFNEQYYKDDQKNAGPTIYNAILSQFPYAQTYMVAGWTLFADLAEFNKNGLPGAPASNVTNLDEGKYDVATVTHLDTAVTNKLVELLKQKTQNSTNFYGIYQELTDATGHASGFDPTPGSQYMKALATSLYHVNTILSNIDLKNWLVVITTDHGAHGNGHGSQDYKDREVFALLSDNTMYKKGNKLPETIQGQASIVPTILHYLGITQPTSINSSYIGDSNLDNVPFYVKFPASSSELVNPPRLTMRNWSGVSEEDAKKISGIAQTGDYYYFFLNDGQYLRYNISDDKVDQVKRSTSQYWKGISDKEAKQISGITKTGDYYYFFLNDGQYLRYNISDDKVDQVKRSTSRYWKGISDADAKQISSITQTGDHYYFFLNDGRYLRYNIKDDKVDLEEKIAENWPGMCPYATHIMAATSDGYIFISMKNDLYNYNK